MHTCTQCKTQFRVTEEDLAFYAQFDSPPPTLCSNCRQQRRLTYRNERIFYKRTCDLTKKTIISIYSPEKPVTVYDQEAWWSDRWDPLQYGRDFDFNRPFFEQFEELSRAVPRPSILNMSSENSLYTNHSAYNKNCYMCINTGYSEDLLYCTNYNLYNRDCLDCLAIQNCEACYFCVDTKQASFSSFLHECAGCSFSAFLFDCRNCHNCYGCYNLRNKQYCIFNKQYSKEEYSSRVRELWPRSFEAQQKQWDDFRKLVEEKAIHRGSVIESCENSTGDHLFNNKNVRDSYYTFGSQDCCYCYDCGEMKTARDATEPFKGELQFETHGCNLGYSLMACSKCYECHDICYCQYCWYSSNLFGCFGLRRKEYCIFNKQYGKESYETLKAGIIAHMKKMGEFGEFFPATCSPFAYNETAAYEYYPLTKEEVLARGWKWKDEDNRMPGETHYVPPDDIAAVQDSIENEVLSCISCGKNYRIIAKELNLYRKAKLPITRHCFDCRYRMRMSLRNARKLWQRQCTRCGSIIQSTIAPDRLIRQVYCEECYKKAVYG